MNYVNNNYENWPYFMEHYVKMIVLCKIKIFFCFFLRLIEFLLNSKLKLMTEAEKIVTNTIICTICGGAGHVPSDCKFRKNADGTNAELNPDGSLMISGTNRVEQQKLDCEVRFLKVNLD